MYALRFATVVSAAACFCACWTFAAGDVERPLHKSSPELRPEPSAGSTNGARNIVDLAKEYIQEITSRGVFRAKYAPKFSVEGTVLKIGSFRASPIGNPRRKAVLEAAQDAWDAYERHAWGYDEVNPSTHSGVDTFAPGLGMTIVDSLSTLYIMGGLDGRYQRARDWVERDLRFENVGRVIVFETVIRVLGSLVSMFHLSGDEMYAKRAEELGARLAVAFGTEHNFPWPRCYLNETGRCETHYHDSDVLYLAEVGTVQLEYRALALHSHAEVIRHMRAITEGIVRSLQDSNCLPPRLQGRHRALLPYAISMSKGAFNTNKVTVGAPADSYFEYIIKLWVQGGRKERAYWELFANVADSIVELVAHRSAKGDVILREVFATSSSTHSFSDRQDHFSCFLPGALILALDGLDTTNPEDVIRKRSWEALAADVTETCYKMYSRSPSGLSGESVRLAREDVWRQSGPFKLRPEAVEAMFYMYRHTRDERYQEWGWEIFESMQRWCKTDIGGYATLRNAKSRKPVKDVTDAQPSFFIAETLKYLYLLFGDDEDELPLDRWVFNTEAYVHQLLFHVIVSACRPKRLAPRLSRKICTC